MGPASRGGAELWAVVAMRVATQEQHALCSCQPGGSALSFFLSFFIVIVDSITATSLLPPALLPSSNPYPPPFPPMSSLPIALSMGYFAASDRTRKKKYICNVEKNPKHFNVST